MTSKMLTQRPPTLVASQLYPDPDTALKVRSQLAGLLRIRVQEPATAIERDLPEFGITKRLTEPELVRSAELGTWYFVDGFKDPSIRTFGGQPIPKAIRRELREIANAGVQLDRIFVAHQLPDDWPEDAPLPQLVPDRPEIRRVDEALITVGQGLVRGTIAAGRGLAVGTALVAGGALAVAGGALDGLDPIILGGVDHPTEPATIWAVLARWDWPAA